MKTKNVMRLSQILVDEHGGEVPREREALESLPGVGRKTANVVLNTAFGVPVIAVDTHIFRVSNRTGLAPGKDSGRRCRSARARHARALQAPRASLADPARALCLRCAEAEVPGLRHRRHLPLQGQDRAGGRVRRGCALAAVFRHRNLLDSYPVLVALMRSRVSGRS